MELESGMSIVFLVQPPRPQFKNLICFLIISSAFGRGGASVPNSTIRRGLFERSEFPSHIIRCRGGVHPQGRAQANMVLGHFAETPLKKPFVWHPTVYFSLSSSLTPRPARRLCLAFATRCRNRGSCSRR